MTEWVEYTGSDEQIAEMRNAPHGWIVEYIDTNEPIRTAISQICFPAPQDTEVIQKYLICRPHPLADMIGQQAQTGQPVWVRGDGAKDVLGNKIHQYCMHGNDINWNIPNAEYSFTRFEEEV